MKLTICPKCESKEIKVIQPEKVGNCFLFACEKCNYEYMMPNNETSRRLHDVEQFYINLIVSWSLDGEITKETLKDFKLACFAKIFEEADVE